MSVVIVADIVSDVITIRHSIGFEEKHCNAIIKCINFLLKKGNGGTFDQAFLNQLCNCGKDTKERHDNYTIDDAVTIIKTIDSHFFDRLNAPK